MLLAHSLALVNTKGRATAGWMPPRPLVGQYEAVHVDVADAADHAVVSFADCAELLPCGWIGAFGDCNGGAC